MAGPEAAALVSSGKLLGISLVNTITANPDKQLGRVVIPEVAEVSISGV